MPLALMPCKRSRNSAHRRRRVMITCNSNLKNPRSTKTSLKTRRRMSVAKDLRNSPTRDNKCMHYSLCSCLFIKSIKPIHCFECTTTDRNSLISLITPKPIYFFIMSWSTNAKYSILHTGRRKREIAKKHRSKSVLKRSSSKLRTRSGATQRLIRRCSPKYPFTY